MQVKRLVGIAVVALALVAASASAQNNECWQDGYKQGFCDARGQNRGMCLPPLPPLPPLAPLGRDDCQSRFADGYRAGLSAGSR